jgi:predicted transcriptional regulator
MDSLIARRKATIDEVRGVLPALPTDKEVRRMLEKLEEKRRVKRRKEGRECVDRPTLSKKKAGEQSLKHVLETLFENRLDQAFAVHRGSSRS